MEKTLTQALRDAQADLAFALAQGDGLAEDEAAARVSVLEAAIKDAQASGVDPAAVTAPR